MSNTALVASASEKREAVALVARKLNNLYRELAQARVGKIAGDPFAARHVARLERAITLLTTGE